jgi:hypothetical protein
VPPYKKSETNPFGCGRSALASAPYQPGDEVVGEYTRERLIKMDAKFCERMQRAIERGLERPPEGEAERAA